MRRPARLPPSSPAMAAWVDLLALLLALENRVLLLRRLAQVALDDGVAHAKGTTPRTTPSTPARSGCSPGLGASSAIYSSSAVAKEVGCGRGASTAAPRSVLLYSVDKLLPHHVQRLVGCPCGCRGRHRRAGHPRTRCRAFWARTGRRAPSNDEWQPRTPSAAPWRRWPRQEHASRFRPLPRHRNSAQARGSFSAASTCAIPFSALSRRVLNDAGKRLTATGPGTCRALRHQICLEAVDSVGLIGALAARVAISNDCLAFTRPRPSPRAPSQPSASRPRCHSAWRWFTRFSALE